ncbi:MAG: hypothetical protein V2G51_06500 [bacterium JZ-2024 1]
MQSTKTICNTKNQLQPNTGMCNECGRNVGWKSGLFEDRVVHFDNHRTRKKMNKPFPEGDYISRECEEKLKSIQKPYYEKPGFILYHANCLDILAELPENSVDMVFADPPYLLSNGGFTVHAGRRVSVNKGDWDKSNKL